ncbi:MAG: AarF/ABC1/UbiB kinase family protein [Acidimicrobiales bacterium]|nr:AarF/ABC1/UbiB kinase family protein [Acidimicrobiales bacterium]
MPSPDAGPLDSRTLDGGTATPATATPATATPATATAAGDLSAAGPADLVLGTFSDTPPWLIEPDAMTWRRRVPALRSVTRRSVPELTTPPRVPPLRRMVRTVYELGSAVGLWWLKERRQGNPTSRAALSRRVRVAAEHLGPTYIKLGQIISSGEGLFPAELVNEFRLLRDQVPAEEFDAVRRVVEEDLGRPLEAVFSRFERTPLAAASIAQVHAATLRGSGVEVVVKVQRPAVGTLVRQDLRVMAWLAPFLIGRIPIAALANPPALVELFAETITEELDFRIEAANMLDIAASLAELNQRSFVIPRPHPSLVTRRVLVMERLDGFRFDDVVGMQAAGLDTHAIIRAGMIGFLEGCMISGIFHGDLHGGNLFVRPDGRTALLDFGITARMTPGERHAFLRLLMTASMNDVRGQLAALRDLGTLPPDTDLDAVIRDLNLDGPPVDPTQLTPDELVAEIQKMVKQLLAYGARLPKILMLFVKNLVFLDGAIASLAPGLDLFAEITHLSLYFATTHGERIAAEIGVAPEEYKPDLSGIKASFGVDPNTTHSLTYAELQERRELIRSRLRDRIT